MASIWDVMQGRTSEEWRRVHTYTSATPSPSNALKGGARKRLIMTESKVKLLLANSVIFTHFKFQDKG
jgi:hypothetical protein